MNIIQTKLNGVYIINPTIFADERGWFMETYSKITMAEIPCEFVQDNHSYTTNKNTLRGLHFQNSHNSQAKLVRCINGSILDVAVDLRINSSTYLEWISVELSKANNLQLFIPRGFAHGFLTLSDNVEVIYKVDNNYNLASERTIIWNDPDLAIDWGTTNPILSQKDKSASLLKDINYNFLFKEDI